VYLGLKSGLIIRTGSWDDTDKQEQEKILLLYTVAPALDSQSIKGTRFVPATTKLTPRSRYVLQNPKEPWFLEKKVHVFMKPNIFKIYATFVKASSCRQTP
jgi:hypothetical protein